MFFFNLIIIGDEILHGNRQDKHFAFFKNLLEQHGFILNQVQYLPDEPKLLTKQLARSFSDGTPTFITGGIGATTDDHTRQAAAAALNLPIARHKEAAKLIDGVTLNRHESLDSKEHQQRLKMADFPQGAAIIPNSYNSIAGFSIFEHYFLPGFPVMAQPMAQWVLNTYYAPYFHQMQRKQHSIYIISQPESRITPVMEYIEKTYPGIRTFSLPSVGGLSHEGTMIPPHIEFGVKADGKALPQLNLAWEDALKQLQSFNMQLQTEI